MSEARTTAPARAFDRRLIRLAMTERRTLAGSVVLGLVVAAARIATGIWIALAITRVLQGTPIGDVLPWLGLAVALVGLRAACTAIQEGMMAGASVRITADLRHRLVDRIMQLGPGWVTEERSGELEAVLVDGVEKLDAYFRLFLSKVIVAGISAVAIVIVIWIVDPVVGAVVAVFAAIVVAIPPIEYRALGSHMRFWSESYRPLDGRVRRRPAGHGDVEDVRCGAATRRRPVRPRRRRCVMRRSASRTSRRSSGVAWRSSRARASP